MHAPSVRGPSRVVLLAALLLVGSGCHHVIIDGGLEPTEARYDEEWNLAFAVAIFPAQPQPPAGCEGYFSRVETRQSFLNLVVSAITSGIISPMESRVRCGEPGSGAGDGGPALAGGLQAAPAAGGDHATR